MTKQGIDYSWARPGGGLMAAQGYKFAMRYISPYPAADGRALTLAEKADLHDNGIDIGLIWETTAGRMFDGYPAGVVDAQKCLQAANLLGAPDDVPFYFACDVDIDPNQLALVDDYVAGCATELPLLRIGGYGEYDLIEHWHNRGNVAWYFQTYAWSNGKRHPYTHVYQYLNGQVLNGAVDYCEAYGENQGLWRSPMPGPTLEQTQSQFDELNAAVMKREKIRAVASGDYDKMLQAWTLLKNAGLV